MSQTHLFRASNGGTNCTACGAMNWYEDMDKHAPVGKYDGLFVYFKAHAGPWRLDWPRPCGQLGGALSCVNWVRPSAWTRGKA